MLHEPPPPIITSLIFNLCDNRIHTTSILVQSRFISYVLYMRNNQTKKRRVNHNTSRPRFVQHSGRGRKKSASNRMPDVCDQSTFADCELAILRMAVDKAEEKMGKRIVNSEDVQKIIDIVEQFIKHKKVVCYGGTAINNILPEEDRFYNKDAELPDYDFFTMNAMNDAKELADIYYKKGFLDVEAKSGQHHGTYKVFVNFMAVADLTYLPKDIFQAISMDAIQVGGILYAPPNFLRMSMYLELSRPAGDTSRWEKVMKRLTLLNKHYPITDENCSQVPFQRELGEKTNLENEDKIFSTVRNTLINQGVVFFGGFANMLYSQYMPKQHQKQLKEVADFDVLSNEPDQTVQIVKERLDDIGIEHVDIIHHPAVGEIVPDHQELRVGKDTILFVYKPIGCHSYNTIRLNGRKTKVATIDTMLSFYLAFLYANRPYYNQFLERILCMSDYLFKVQQKNRLAQKGLLRRFSITCYGHQETLEEMKAKKAKKYRELKETGDKKAFEEWFMNYKPSELEGKKTKTKTKTKALSSSHKPRTRKTTNKKSNDRSKTTKTKPFLLF